MVRLRFDAAYDFNRPDRAEFFYTTWEARGGKNPNPGTPPPVGPGFPDPDIDRQELSLYVERAFGNDFSAFVRLPVVFSNPLHNPNDAGFGDIQAGIKLALWQDRDQLLTFRLNNYIPTADAAHSWVGTGHYSIEPGLLYYARLTDRWTLEGEARDWISIGGAKNPLPNLDGSAAGSDYAGNVLRYGVAALGYNLVQGRQYRLTPVVETVGWSVLEGQVFDFNDQLVVPGRPDPPNSGAALDSVDADGDTIVNLKIGARVADYRGTSVYGGWGRSLTGDRWYRDIFRFEIRRSF